MRTYELLREERVVDYLQRLAQLKIKTVGAGSYSRVFQHPTQRNVAVKLVMNNPTYVKFARFCQENQGNRWLPKVLDVVSVEFDAENNRKVDGTFVFMEKLHEADDKFIQQTLKKMLAELPLHELMFKGLFFSTKSFRSFYNGEWNEIATHHSDPELKKVARFFEDNVNRLDLHNENVMVRGSGTAKQLVFVDPFIS